MSPLNIDRDIHLELCFSQSLHMIIIITGHYRFFTHLSNTFFAAVLRFDAIWAVLHTAS